MGGQHPNLTEQQQIKLKSGKIVQFQGGIKIVKNPQTGQLEGVPQQWMNIIKVPYEINTQKCVKTKGFKQQIRAQQNLPQSIRNLINSKPVQLQKFVQPKKQIELIQDPKNKYGIKNLPNQWVFKLNQSQISPEDVKSDPKGTIDIINNFEDQLKQSTFEMHLITNKQFQEHINNVKFIEENPANKYLFDKQLGKGAMCKVFYARDRDNSNPKEYACRIIKINDKKTIQKIRTQIAVMKLCHEKNLVNYFFSYYYKQSLFMFVEYMNAGALTDFVYHYMKRIPENVIAFLMKEMLLGLQALHQKRQLHRDLKSDNILLSLSGDVKIADFGFAMQLTKERLNRKSCVGTPAWMAPQLCRKEDYDEKVDIWSIGIVAIQLCNGQPPYLRLPHLKAMHQIVSKEPPKVKSFTPKLCDFVQRCCQKNPADRWSASKLLQHKFIKQIGKGIEAKQKLVEMLSSMKKNGIVKLE